MLKGLNIGGKIMAIVLFITLLPDFSMAQTDRLYRKEWSGGRTRRDLDNEDNYLTLFYHNTAKDTINSKFKKVVIRKFYCDSIYKHNNGDNEDDRTIMRFNKIGQKTFEKDLDIESWWDHPVTGKHVLKYDSKGNKTMDKESNDDYGDKLRVKNYEKWKYDKLSRVTEDDRLISGRGYRSRPSTEYYWYDSNSNIIHDRTIVYDKEKHTNFITNEFYTFNKHNQEIYEIDNRPSGFTYKYYHVYNDKGQLLWSSENMGTKDSDWTIITRWPDGRKKETDIYREGKETEIYSFSKGKNGEKVDIDEELSTADPLSCPNNTITVTTSDSSDNLLSRVSTKQEEGHPLVTTTLEKYTKTKGLYIDSSLIKSEGYMYQETWIKVQSRKSDDSANILEEISQDGVGYTLYSREVYQYNSHNMVTGEKDYDACFADKPAKEIITTYLPDGVSIQTETVITPGVTFVTEYDSYGRKAREKKKTNYMSNGKLSPDYSVTEYTYTK